jgi:GNAT superfamily N-acetyltransferase
VAQFTSTRILIFPCSFRVFPWLAFSQLQTLNLSRFIMFEINIKPLDDTPEIRQALCEIIVEVVANGGSVSFLHPLPLAQADAFWQGSLASAARGERVVLGAFEGETLVGTVTLLLDCPPNQPHRGEIAKMMTRFSHRGRGVGKALLHAAEQIAVERGKTLLVLDTAVEEGASGFYEKQGYSLTGVIPDYALTPHGRPTGTMIYWKRIGDWAFKRLSSPAFDGENPRPTAPGPLR